LTITTMTVDIEIPEPGARRLRAAIARSVGSGPRPGVVVIHEVFGDQPEMRECAASSPGTATWR
jgi:dienelactone hydrolase